MITLFKTVKGYLSNFGDLKHPEGPVFHGIKGNGNCLRIHSVISFQDTKAGCNI